MIEPIYQLLFGRHLLGLPKDQIVVSCSTYKTGHPSHMQNIMDQKLAPGKKFDCVFFSL